MNDSLEKLIVERVQLNDWTIIPDSMVTFMELTAICNANSLDFMHDKDKKAYIVRPSTNVCINCDV